MADRLIPSPLRAGRLLDIGCGTTPFFLIGTSFSEKFGLDAVHEGAPDLAGAGGKIVLAHFDAGGAAPLPFPDGAFSAVTMLAVLEHIDPERVPPLFREVRRVLRAGGLFVVTTPARWAGGLLRLMARAGLVSPEEIEEHKEGYTAEMVVSRLAASGFSPADIRHGSFELGANIWVAAIRT